MNANELMIGDWVRCTDPKPFRIEQIDGIEELVYGDDGFFVNTADLQPIPLTGEILEKNGFEDVGDCIYQITERPYWFWVDFYNHQYGSELDTSTYINEDSERIIKLNGIPYVHELQHALRMCGAGKDIKI